MTDDFTKLFKGMMDQGEAMAKAFSPRLTWMWHVPGPAQGRSGNGGSARPSTAKGWMPRPGFWSPSPR
jgi:hypothetical protein